MDNDGENLNSNHERTENKQRENEALAKFLSEFKIEVSIFHGYSDKENVFEFLEKLMLLQERKESSEVQILKYVLPKCPKDAMFLWWQFKRETGTTFAMHS